MARRTYRGNHRYDILSKAEVSVEEVAARLGVSAHYLRRILRRGDAPYDLAERLSRCLGCRMENFL